MSRIEFRNVSKVYRGGVRAVDRISLTVEDGEFFSLLGPSGSGKTTLLRLVAGFLRPSEGTIFLGDEDIAALPPEKRDIGVVFQNYALFPHMTVFENIAFGLRLRHLTLGETQDRVRASLEQLELVGYEARYPRELSGGQQQRVALARALVIQPRVLLLDEPLGALDRKLREQMQFWIRELQVRLGITTLYVTHDQSEALTMSDRIAVIHLGRIEQVGTPQAIYNSPVTRFVSEFIGESNILAGHVAGACNGVLQVTLPGGQTVMAASDHLGAHAESVLISIRPEHINIARHPAAGAHNCFDGRVVKEFYRGALHRYHVELPGNEPLMVDVHGEAETMPVGSRVVVSWSPQSCRILRDAHG